MNAALIEARAGKYLTFLLGGECYGLEILKVQEIIGIMTVTRVPNTPPFIRGVINLRGRVIPVMDLRLKFGLPGQEDSDRTCIIVVQLSEAGGVTTKGLIVDEVSEVLDIKAENIEPPPMLGGSIDTDCIHGMGKTDQKIIMLLEIDKVVCGGQEEPLAD